MIALLFVMAMSYQEENDLVERALSAPAAADRLRAYTQLSTGGTLRSLKTLLEGFHGEPTDGRWALLARYTARVGGESERAKLCDAPFEIEKATAQFFAHAFAKGAYTPCIQKRLEAMAAFDDPVTVKLALDAVSAHTGATVAYERLLAILKTDEANAFGAVILLGRHKGAPLDAQRAVLAHAAKYAKNNPSEGMPSEHWRALKTMSGKKLPRTISAWKQAL